MRATRLNRTGEKLNFCPFGCPDHALDDRGFCRHLVGFTTDGKTYEPLVLVKGRRTTQVPTKVVGGERTPDLDALPKVQASDKLERVTVSSRVYRDVPEAAPAVEPEPEEARSSKRKAS